MSPVPMPDHEYTIPPPAPERRCTCRAHYTCPACVAYAQRLAGRSLTDARLHAGQVRGNRIRTAVLAVLADQPQPVRVLVALLAAQGIHVSTHALYHHLVTLSEMRRAVSILEGTRLLWVRASEERDR